MECPICMEGIEVTKNCVTTECGHSFHANCLMRNVAFNGFGCPYCRFEMVEDVSDESEYEEDDDDGEEDDNDNDDDDNDDDEENDEEEDGEVEDENKPMPSFKLIEKKLIEQGITYECLLKGFMYYSFLGHLYGDIYEESLQSSDKLEEIIENVINNYSSEQEEEVNSLKEFNFYFLQDEYKERNFYKELEDTMVHFLNLDDMDDLVNNVNIEYDNLFSNVINEIY